MNNEQPAYEPCPQWGCVRVKGHSSPHVDRSTEALRPGDRVEIHDGPHRRMATVKILGNATGPLVVVPDRPNTATGVRLQREIAMHWGDYEAVAWLTAWLVENGYEQRATTSTEKDGEN